MNKKGLAEEKQLLLLFEVLIIILVVVGLVSVIMNRGEVSDYKDIDEELFKEVKMSISNNVVIVVIEREENAEKSAV